MQDVFALPRGAREVEIVLRKKTAFDYSEKIKGSETKLALPRGIEPLFQP